MPNIFGALGNAGRYMGEWSMNMANPQRQQSSRDFQNAMQLMKMKAILEGQQANALNQRALEEIRMQGERDKVIQQYNTMRDTAQPPWMREQAGRRNQYEPPRVDVPGMTNLGALALRRTDPNAFNVPMTPLQQSEISKNEAGAADLYSQASTRRPRAPDQYSFYDELTPLQRARALGALAPEATAGGLTPDQGIDNYTGILEAHSKALRGEPALDRRGNPVIGPDGQPVMMRGESAYSPEFIEAMRKKLYEEMGFSPVAAPPVSAREVAEWLKRAGLTTDMEQKPFRKKELTPEREKGLDALLSYF